MFFDVRETEAGQEIWHLSDLGRREDDIIGKCKNNGVCGDIGSGRGNSISGTNHVLKEYNESLKSLC